MSRLRIAPAVALCAAGLVACGSSSSAPSATGTPPSASASASTSASASADSQDVAAAKRQLKEAFLQAVRTGSMPIPLDADGAACVASAMVDHLGIDKVAALGLAHDSGAESSLGNADARYLAIRLFECAAPGSARQSFITKINESLGSNVTAAQRTCIDDAVTERSLVDFLAASFSGKQAQGQEAFNSLIQAAARRCISG